MVNWPMLLDHPSSRLDQRTVEPNIRVHCTWKNCRSSSYAFKKIISTNFNVKILCTKSKLTSNEGMNTFWWICLPSISLAPIACRAIILFIQHISLVRPLGEGGILRLVVDFAQIELALSPFCRRLIDLGKHYKILKSFRSLLILSPEEFINNAAVGDVVPYDIVLHHLFSRAPLEIRSPHQVRLLAQCNSLEGLHWRLLGDGLVH